MRSAPMEDSAGPSSSFVVVGLCRAGALSCCTLLSSSETQQHSLYNHRKTGRQDPLNWWERKPREMTPWTSGWHCLVNLHILHRELAVQILGVQHCTYSTVIFTPSKINAYVCQAKGSQGLSDLSLQHTETTGPWAAAGAVKREWYSGCQELMRCKRYKTSIKFPSQMMPQ